MTEARPPVRGGVRHGHVRSASRRQAGLEGATCEVGLEVRAVETPGVRRGWHHLRRFDGARPLRRHASCTVGRTAAAAAAPTRARACFAGCRLARAGAYAGELVLMCSV